MGINLGLKDYHLKQLYLNKVLDSLNVIKFRGTSNFKFWKLEYSNLDANGFYNYHDARTHLRKLLTTVSSPDWIQCRSECGHMKLL